MWVSPNSEGADPFPDEMLLRLFKGVRLNLPRGMGGCTVLFWLVCVGQRSLGDRQAAHMKTFGYACGHLNEIMLEEGVCNPRIPHIAWSFRLF
jgi:hypothetical protein